METEVVKEFEFNAQFQDVPSANLVNGRFGMMLVRKCFKGFKVQEQRLREEISMLQDLAKHPNVVEFKFMQENSQYVMYCHSFTQNVLLHLMHSIRESERRVVKCVGHILNGLFFLHSKKIIVHGVSPFTIRLGEDLQYKIADFSWACTFEERLRHSSYGMLAYRAPELINPVFTSYDENVDLWSAGCVLSEIITGKPLFNQVADDDQLSLIKRVDQVQMRSIHPNISEALFVVMKTMLSLEPVKRKSALQLRDALQMIYSGIAKN